VLWAIQNRIRQDRFTGGVQDGALFNEMPAWPVPGGGSTLTLTLTLDGARPGKDAPEDAPRSRPPEPHEVDLLLQVYHDLWSGDLPIGGGVNVGRGVVRGLRGGLSVADEAGGAWTWQAAAGDDIATPLQLVAGDAAHLRERYAGKLWAWVNTRPKQAGEAGDA